MKKFSLLLLSLVCFCSLSTFATHDSCCEHNKQVYKSAKKNCEKPHKKSCVKKQENNCEKPCPVKSINSCFLCKDVDKNTLFSQMNLSETQICTANKIHDKYEQEIYSLQERIICEHQKLDRLKADCAKKSEQRKQKRVIKKLEKKKKEICKCYEKQFLSIVSNEQKKVYKRCIK